MERRRRLRDLSSMFIACTMVSLFAWGVIASIDGISFSAADRSASLMLVPREDR